MTPVSRPISEFGILKVDLGLNLSTLFVIAHVTIVVHVIKDERSVDAFEKAAQILRVSGTYSVTHN